MDQQQNDHLNWDTNFDAREVTYNLLTSRDVDVDDHSNLDETTNPKLVSEDQNTIELKKRNIKRLMVPRNVEVADGVEVGWVDSSNPDRVNKRQGYEGHDQRRNVVAMFENNDRQRRRHIGQAYSNSNLDETMGMGGQGKVYNRKRGDSYSKVQMGFDDSSWFWSSVRIIQRDPLVFRRQNIPDIPQEPPANLPGFGTIGFDGGTVDVVTTAGSGSASGVLSPTSTKSVQVPSTTTTKVVQEPSGTIALSSDLMTSVAAANNTMSTAVSKSTILSVTKSAINIANDTTTAMTTTKSTSPSATSSPSSSVVTISTVGPAEMYTNPGVLISNQNNNPNMIQSNNIKQSPSTPATSSSTTALSSQEAQPPNTGSKSGGGLSSNALTPLIISIGVVVPLVVIGAIIALVVTRRRARTNAERMKNINGPASGGGVGGGGFANEKGQAIASGSTFSPYPTQNLRPRNEYEVSSLYKGTNPKHAQPPVLQTNANNNGTNGQTRTSITSPSDLISSITKTVGNTFYGILGGSKTTPQSHDPQLPMSATTESNQTYSIYTTGTNSVYSNAGAGTFTRPYKIPQRSSSISAGSSASLRDIAAMKRANQQLQTPTSKRATNSFAPITPMEDIPDSVDTSASSISTDTSVVENRGIARYEVSEPWMPMRFDELALTPGLFVIIYKVYEDGWCDGRVEGTDEEGVFPMACLKNRAMSLYNLVIGQGGQGGQQQQDDNMNGDEDEEVIEIVEDNDGATVVRSRKQSNIENVGGYLGSLTGVGGSGQHTDQRVSPVLQMMGDFEKEIDDELQHRSGGSLGGRGQR
ncbi:hypothetical protein HDU76_014086 [Blyttiomyces sp. JEL0837]|nr:hypothetical protein HDU76_014086 [Blyttiomyces sp. JEL0837]